MMLNNNAPKIPQQLYNIRKKIDLLKIPHSSFIGLTFGNERAYICILGGEKIIIEHTIYFDKNIYTQTLDWLKKTSRENNLKYIAIGLSGRNYLDEFASKLWLKEDIVPFVFLDKKNSIESAKSTLFRVKEYFKDNTPKLQISPSNEIKTSFLYSLSEYKKNVFSKIFFSS